MKKIATKMRGMRLSEATYKAVVLAAKVRSYDSPSAFMRTAIEKELRGADATLNESEQRIIASLERYSKQVRRVSTGQQALFAYVDAFGKSDLEHTAGYRRGHENSGRSAGETTLLPVPKERWSEHGGRRSCRAIGVGGPPYRSEGVRPAMYHRRGGCKT